MSSRMNSKPSKAETLGFHPKSHRGKRSSAASTAAQGVRVPSGISGNQEVFSNLTISVIETQEDEAIISEDRAAAP